MYLQHYIKTITAQKAILTIIVEQYLSIRKLIVTVVFLYKLTLTLLKNALLWYTGSLK